MMTFTGKLTRHDFGGGGWVLETDAGEKIALYGPVDKALTGKNVVVDGQKVDAMGIGMVGSGAIQVEKVSEA